MLKFNRGERRFQTTRLKAKRTKVRSKSYQEYLKGNPRALGILARTACPCTCWMCSNGSKIFGNQAEGKHKHELSALEFFRKGLA